MLSQINTIDDGHHRDATLLTTVIPIRLPDLILTIGMDQLHLDHLHATTAHMSGAFEVDRRHLRLASILILEMQLLKSP
jgi:hypothetical protein